MVFKVKRSRAFGQRRFC